MNHHVRNALQAIKYAHFLDSQKEDKLQLEVIGSSVDRIEWALTEILPGKSRDAAAPNLPATAKSPNYSRPKSA